MRRSALVLLAVLAASVAAQPTNLQTTVNSTTSVTITWNALAGASSYEVLRSSGGGFVVIGTSTSTRFTDATASANTTYLYQVRSVGGLNSASVYAGTFSFTDDPLVAGTTTVKLTHIDELRTKVNAMRVFGSLSAASFTDPTLTTSTPVRAVHITELRTALNAARTALGMQTITFTDSTLTANVTLIKAAHVSELRGGTRQPSTTGAVLNGPPVFTSSAATSIAENLTAVMTVTTTDPESNARTYAVFGGADSAKFSIHPTSGALTFNSAPNFESPTDAGSNNVYDVIVSASDGQGNVAAMAIAVTITNVNEGPSFTSSGSVSTTELVDGVFHTATASDPEGDALTFTITGGADQSDLSITTGGGLSFNTPPDFFAPHDSDTNNVYVVNVQVSSSGGTATLVHSITVTQMSCTSLSLGGVFTVSTPVPKTFCLSSGAEYTLVASNVSEDTTASLTITATGITAVTGPPAPIAGHKSARRFEPPLRERQYAEVAARHLAAAADDGGIRANAITPGVPALNALMNLNVETATVCDTPDTRQGRVEVVGTHIIIMQEVSGGNPVISGGLSTSDYQDIADEFDDVIWPAVTAAFGTPADIDTNSRIIAFYTSEVNTLTPTGEPVNPGFFLSRDLLSAGSCATSNVGEMVYLLMADPTGSINGNVRSVSTVKELTMRTLAHELEHLINASRRMYVNTPFVAFEKAWLDEGLAHVAEELAFYEKAGVSPRSNIDAAVVGGDADVLDAFFRYVEPTFGKLREWLLAPQASGPLQTNDEDANRGSAWSFLRYASDRRGGTENTFWQGFTSNQQTGLTNLETNIGTASAPWFADFGAATYSDDATTGVASQFSHPSWDFRDLYSNLDYDPGPSCSCAYELDTIDPADGVPSAFGLASGASSAYVRLGAPSTRAIIKLRGPGDAQAPSHVQLRVFRRE